MCEIFYLHFQQIGGKCLWLKYHLYLKPICIWFFLLDFKVNASTLTVQWEIIII